MRWRWLGPVIMVGVVGLGVLASPSGTRAQTTIYVIRHCEKQEKPVVDDPPLSDVGRRRSRALAALLHSTPISTIYVTPFKRSRETAAPLADSLNLESREVDPAKTQELAETLKTRHDGQSVLVVTHSGLATELLRGLGAGECLIPEDRYDDLFVVTLVGRKCVTVQHLHYGTSAFIPVPPRH